MAERSLPAFVVAGLIVVGSLVAAAVLSSPSGFLGGTRGAENQSTDGLASSTPTPDAWGGSVVGTLPVGNQPYGVGYDSGNGYVYVANYNSNNVSMINGTTVVATVAVGTNLFGVGYDIGSGFVYATNVNSNDVSVLSGTSVVATIPVGNTPVGVAYNGGNGYIYVTNQYSNNVSVINGTTVVASVAVGTLPVGVAYDSGNGYVYVANYNSNTVSVISATLVVTTIPVGSLPIGVAYDDGNGYVYVANSVSNDLSVINGATVVATVLVGNAPSGVAYDSGNGYIYVANNGANTVSVIATTRPPGPLFLVTFIETGLPSGTSWSVTLDDLLNRSTTPTITFSGPNGTYSFAVGRIRGDTAYYYAIPASGSLAVNGTPVSVPVSFTADTRGGTVVATVPTGTYPLAVAYDSGNGYIYVTNQYSNNVSVINGTTVVASVAVGAYLFGVAYDDGNGYIYVANPGSNAVSVINGTAVVATLPVGNQPYGVGYDSGNGYIYVASSGSNTVHAVFGTVLVGWTTVGYAPYGVAYDSGNGYVYVANRGSNNVSVISGTTVVATIPVGNIPYGVAYDSENGYVYVANSGSNNVSVISGTTVVATIPVGNIPYGVAYDSENGYVYVANSGSNTTSVISTTTPGPTTTATLAGTAGSGSWFVTPVGVTLTASDAASVIVATNYSIDAGTWQEYMAPFTVSGDGNHTVQFYSVNAAGFTESTETLAIHIDTTSPTASAVPSGTQGGDEWFISQATVTLSASDRTSGVGSISYNLDGGMWTAYSGPITLSDGAHTLLYGATDVAGNTASVKSLSVRVDTIAPSLTDLTPSGRVTTSAIDVTWTGSDSGSGIVSYAVSVDGRAFQNVALNESVILSLSDGAHTITVRATDAAGNTQTQTTTVTVDTNLFSFTGPLGGLPTIALITIIAVVPVALVFIRKRKRRVSAPPKQPRAPPNP